ncbi:MAG: family 43 glycosylhydrolase [Clostridia bacterium]|nr:family 43 glycosylhydrolase [Clostridia bacterium]
MKNKSFIILGLILLNLFNQIYTLQGGESDFNGINLAKSFKDLKNHNPCLTQKFSADPGVMEYNGRVYVYGTNDGYLQSTTPAKNEYGRINQINVMSSADLVNWSDHGTINVAGSNGAAKWAANSWAPTAAHKTINGKEKFFLYFANNASGIGVLVSDSPTGPWTDPIGGPLISRSTPNCNVEWLFDPAVFVDSDGNGYLYFGGGVPNGKQENPQTIRAIKLGDDMISLSGTAVNIDAPWAFEDSGINKIGNTYLYSYCTNWSGGPLGNAKIAYMSSSNPLGPYKYEATCFNNPGDFFQTVGNNHHTIIYFKNQYYIFYHAEWLNRETYGSMLGYRTTHVDVMPVNGDKFGNAKGTLTGVAQQGEVDPYQLNHFYTSAWQAGIEVYGLGDTASMYNRGDWTGVSGVNFSQGAKSISVNGGSANGATVRITTDSPSGTVIGYFTIPPTGDNYKYTDITAEITGTTGVHNIFFVASADVVLNNYKFSP